MALRNLSANNDDNQVKIASLGGIQALVKAMEAYVDSAAVQEQGCAALLNLSVNADNPAKIASLGGRQVLQDHLAAHNPVEISSPAIFRDIDTPADLQAVRTGTILSGTFTPGQNSA